MYLQVTGLTDPYRVSDEVWVERIESACAEREAEPNLLELLAKERTRLPVDLHDGHARLLGAERDKVLLDGEHSVVEVCLSRCESAVRWKRAR